MKILTKLMLSVMLATLFATQLLAQTFKGGRTDFRDETIYFVMTTRFYDGDPSNNTYCWDGKKNDVANHDPEWRGDFKGLIDKLDYIKALGFTAIWITPVVENASGFDYHGYHASNFSKVDHRYESGSAANPDVTFQSLIDAAHAKGMKIILDIVLNHTGNFGEENLCKMFDRNWDVNQSNINKCMIPFTKSKGGLLPDDYRSKVDFQYGWRLANMKNTDGVNHDTHNYWHHFAHFNWDEPNRTIGQIAGDCVDLNTENPQVYNYLVNCYGNFIKMGVDGFRIDTSGHIARITFNKAFIPAFHKIANSSEAKAKRGNMPFYMFGEVCARFGGVQYRGQDQLSPYFYTWQTPASLMSQWNEDPTYWDNIVVKEGEGIDNDNIKLWFQESDFGKTSNNHKLNGNAYHTPDYSEASGFNVIDFPMHYNFNSAGQAVNIANEGDHLYNDATWNVVYVDSHDYCPGPNDGTRFNGGTEQWAENLSLMFTFRGIPCIYYGSEVEFQKGVTIDKGPELALANSGRAYFGEYVKGNVTATDFGAYTATGNVAKTLNYSLAKHITRLNQLRAAVPALRKGQYSYDGCSNTGGFAYKRRYTANGEDSYVLVALNGGSYSFTGIENGTYTELITGEKKTGSSISGSFSGRGNLRIWVKDFQGGKVGEDGQFLYGSSPVACGAQPSFTDPGDPDCYYDDEEYIEPGISATPNGGSFKTDTKEVTLTATEMTSSWYKIGNGAQTAFTGTATLTVGEGLQYEQSVTVSWGGTTKQGKAVTGSATFTKKDPTALRTIYFEDTAKWGSVNIYAWSADEKKKEFGAWPGTKLTTKNSDGIYDITITDDDMEKVIFNKGTGTQTANLDIIDGYLYNADGAVGPYSNTPKPVVTITAPATFEESMTVDITVVGAESATYSINGGAAKAFEGNTSLTITETTNVKVTATNDGGTTTKTATYTKKGDEPAPTARKIYFRNVGNWSSVYCYVWTPKELGEWPGTKMTETTSDGYLVISINDATIANVIFNAGSGGAQTKDLTLIEGHIYDNNGNDLGEYKAPAPDPDYTPGDLNNDGSIDVEDYAILVNILKGVATQVEAADVDQNGSVNKDDLEALKVLITSEMK